MHPIVVCTGCQHIFAYDFTIMGTNRLVPQVIFDETLASFLREGWHVTYHNHAGPQEAP